MQAISSPWQATKHINSFWQKNGHHFLCREKLLLCFATKILKNHTSAFSMLFFHNHWVLWFVFFFFFFKPNPPKTKFLGEFMINFFIQNFIPFLVPPLFLLGLRNIEKKKKKRVGNQAGPCGTFSEKPLYVSCFLFGPPGFASSRLKQ